jgi:hypothetical protein
VAPCRSSSRTIDDNDEEHDQKREGGDSNETKEEVEEETVVRHAPQVVRAPAPWTYKTNRRSTVYAPCWLDASRSVVIRDRLPPLHTLCVSNEGGGGGVRRLTATEQRSLKARVDKYGDVVSHRLARMRWLDPVVTRARRDSC